MNLIRLFLKSQNIIPAVNLFVIKIDFKLPNIATA